jgi:iron complex transport system ATP-binding protein
MSVISLSDIVFSYNGRDHTVFDGLSLDIPPGTVTAILGPNGSGKTTLLHLILGILSPREGVILLAHRPRHQYTRRDVGKLLGLVSQDEYIPFNFSVLEYVLLGRAPHLQLLETPGPEDRRVAQQTLANLGLDHLQDRSIQSLSGGERQLVMVARALAQQPRILLMDEPTSHLDLSNKGRVLSIIQRLAAEGVTVVFTTHEPDLAALVAEFVVLMRRGETLAAGPLDAVFTSENLSATYGVPVQVVDVLGKRIVLPPQVVPEMAWQHTS